MSPGLAQFDCSGAPGVAEVRAALVRSGVVELHNLLSSDAIDRWRSTAVDRYEFFADRMRAQGIDPRRDKVRRREAMRRSPGRLDLRLEGDFDPGWWSELSQQSLVLDLVASVLQPGFRHLFSGIVVSQPGARLQHTHRDGGSGLFPEQPLPLPAYALTIFVPLTGFGAEFGPTEFFPGQWLVDPDEDAVAIPAALDSGSALVFDYRIPHRGGANVGECDRIYMYSVLARPWFGDHLNYNEPSLLA